jgi:hypothetical protein
MGQKDDITMRRAALLKAARSMVRLRHSIAADEELNAVLPAIEARFNAEVQRGLLPDVAGLLSEYVNEPAE